MIKRFTQALIFYLLLPWLYLIALLPFAWLYRLSDLCFFLVYYVFNYRRRVVWDNLCYVFPHKSPTELKKVNKAFYQYLCDLLLEHLKVLTISPTEAIQRCRLQNPEILQQLYEQGRHVILATGHYGNWEWAGNAMALQTSYQLNALYKPLSSPYFDTFLQRLRTRFNRKVIRQDQAFRVMSNYGTPPTTTAILADQAPLPNHAYITAFLGQPTYVGKGLEKLAKKLDHAVVYISTQRLRRGYYTLQATLISEYPANTPDTWITEAYIQHLEADIYQQPATWLWSHRRWKNKVGF